MVGYLRPLLNHFLFWKVLCFVIFTEHTKKHSNPMIYNKYTACLKIFGTLPFSATIPES